MSIVHAAMTVVIPGNPRPVRSFDRILVPLKAIAPGISAQVTNGTCAYALPKYVFAASHATTLKTPAPAMTSQNVNGKTRLMRRSASSFEDLAV